MNIYHSKNLTLTLILAATQLFFGSGEATRPASAQASYDAAHIAGLRASVTVRRDERGIPYVEAADEEDLMFAQGYITASDRLWQMDLLRRTARGELAEIFSRAALNEDKRHRVLGFAAIAEKSALQLSEPLRTVLSAYAAGVNAYIASCGDRSLPVEFTILKYRPREWRVSDSL